MRKHYSGVICLEIFRDLTILILIVLYFLLSINSIYKFLKEHNLKVNIEKKFVVYLKLVTIIIKIMHFITINTVYMGSSTNNYSKETLIFELWFLKILLQHTSVRKVNEIFLFINFKFYFSHLS